MHQPFRHLEHLLGTFDTHSEAYSNFLQSRRVPLPLADDIHQLEVTERENGKNGVNEDEEGEGQDDGHAVDDWMLICQPRAKYTQPSSTEPDTDWSLAAKSYPNLGEMPSDIAQQRQKYAAQLTVTTTNPNMLKGKLLEAYTAVCEHNRSTDCSNPHSS